MKITHYRNAAITLVTALLLIVGYFIMSLSLGAFPVVTQQSLVTPSSVPGNIGATITPPMSQGSQAEPTVLIGGREWHGLTSPTDPAEPTLTVEQREEWRSEARSIAICTEEEAQEFVASKLGESEWSFAIARRTTKEQILRWLKGRQPTDPASEISPVLWVVGILVPEALAEAQYLGWTMPSSEPVEGRSTGIRDAIFVFTEDGSPVMADRVRYLQRTISLPHDPFADEEYIAALQGISSLPEVPSQMEAFPYLEALCSMPRE